MKFKISFIFPIIIIILAVISVIYLIEIEPFNYVISAVISVIALAMFWRIYYDVASEKESLKTTAEYSPSSKITDLMKETPKESKMKLDDFLKSSPKDLSSKNLEKDFGFAPEEKNPFSPEDFEEDKYKKMKEEALKELRNVIKPKKSKKKEE